MMKRSLFFSVLALSVAACGSPADAVGTGSSASPPCSAVVIGPATPAESAASVPAMPAVTPVAVLATPASDKPASAPAKAAPAAKKGDGSQVKVKRLVVATGVERAKREPVGAANTFKKGDFDRLFAFVEVENKGDPADVIVTFEPEQTGADAKGNVTLEVGSSPHFRTWAFSRAVDHAGDWVAVVRAADGRELAREPFSVVL